MMSTNDLLEKAKGLSAEDQANLIEALMDQLDQSDQGVDAQWAAEAQSRLDAYRQGKLKAIPLQQVLEKYRVR